MNPEAITAAFVLLGVSVVVRVAPALIDPERFAPGWQSWIVRLPPVVLVNLGVYCLASEWSSGGILAAGVLLLAATTAWLWPRVPVWLTLALAVLAYAAIAVSP